MNAGSTSKAAGVLEISQPAVSQSIRRLEGMAGFRLFERVRSRLVPTQEAGPPGGPRFCRTQRFAT
ncbi:LysR family transcriptional regulator, partial [Burkholderia cenocepacia]|uniref:LysR family transcriptional regulator n=1 Tax=Burkholderia cenocepacia TaxID=95486 RepID=UPI001F2891DC